MIKIYRSMSSSFVAKRVLVTGGAKGAGLGIVKKLHQNGALIFTLGRDGDALKKLQTEFPSVTTAVVDLSDWEATRKVVKSFGRMDHLVNNAGIVYPESFLGITREGLEKTFAINYSAIINVTQVVAQGMIDSGTKGTIVNVSSVADRCAAPGTTVYSGTKAAVTILTKSMAIELAPHNIRANCISPGVINTEIISNLQNSEHKAMLDATIAKALIKRATETSEIADLVLFLLGPQSAMMTGSSVLIDAGITLN